MRRYDLELMVGVFVFCGIIALGYMSIKLGKMEWVGGGGYPVIAVFPNVGGLKVGALVEIAGVEIGRVRSIVLDDDYQAKVVLDINKRIKLQDDAIVSIKTKGLLGEKYVEIIPGGSDEIVESGGRLIETQPPIDLEELIAKFVMGKV